MGEYISEVAFLFLRSYFLKSIYFEKATRFQKHFHIFCRQNKIENFARFFWASQNKCTLWNIFYFKKYPLISLNYRWIEIRMLLQKIFQPILSCFCSHRSVAINDKNWKFLKKKILFFSFSLLHKCLNIEGVSVT